MVRRVSGSFTEQEPFSITLRCIFIRFHQKNLLLFIPEKPMMNMVAMIKRLTLKRLLLLGGALILSACLILPGSDNSSQIVPQIQSGVAHTCVLTMGEKVFCRGQNFSQDLGVSPQDYASPMLVDDLNAIAIGVGWYHTCAATINGRVFCWGRDVYGQLWNNPEGNAATPVEIQGLENVTDITAGSAHTCALTSEGNVYCWGQNNAGQLGDGTLTERLDPIRVEGLSDRVTKIAAGSMFTCVLLDDGSVECWGQANFIPAASDGEQIHLSPFQIPNLAGNVLEIATGDFHLCVITKPGDVMCEGMVVPPNDPPFDGLSNSTAGLQGQVLHLLAGADFTCALTAAHTVECWGDNYFGQLGNQTGISSAIPVPIDLKGQSVAFLGGGHYTACVLLSEGGVSCWGDTSFGQIGDGSARWK